MEDKKIIAYKSGRSKKIAYNLRKLIKKAVMQKWTHLGEEQENKPTLEYIKIGNDRSDLFRTLQSSICECSNCRQSDRDMFYNASLKEWYCIPCVKKYRDYYFGQKSVYGDLADDYDFYETFL